MLVQLVKFAYTTENTNACARLHTHTHTHTHTHFTLQCSVTYDAGACRGAGALQMPLFVLAPTVLRHLSETG